MGRKEKELGKEIHVNGGGGCKAIRPRRRPTQSSGWKW